MSLTWMAWTWPTAAFFVFVFASIAAMGVLEWRSPGGAPRRGILGLDTTRGDRLFITLLGLHLPRLARPDGHAAMGRPGHRHGMGRLRLLEGVRD
jgi:predicted small integral membrane protein